MRFARFWISIFLLKFVIYFQFVFKCWFVFSSADCNFRFVFSASVSGGAKLIRLHACESDFPEYLFADRFISNWNMDIRDKLLLIRLHACESDSP
jgi:hypothetical protein